MSAEIVGVIGIVILLILFLLKVHIAFAMAIVGFTGFIFLNGFESGFTLLVQDMYETFTSYPMSVIPMFVLMGSFAFAAGISQRLYKTAHVWFGAYQGGLTIATVLACASFSAICGSSVATAATMGKIALPEMRRFKYSDALSTGTIAASGTLGIMIPPSTVLIVYGMLVEESIGKLFVAGIIPGIVLSLLFVLTVVIICLRNPELGPAGERTSFKNKLLSSSGVVEAALLFLLAIGGLFLGWFSPTQAGSIGAGGALFIGLVRRQFTWTKLIDSVKDGLRTSCMVLFILFGAVVFGHFMAITSIPFVLSEWVGSLPIPKIAIIGVIVLIFFLGGFFMDAMALIVLLIPIFFPLVISLGYDPIWFGVMIVIVSEIGVITPPVGVNVFVIKGIAPDIPLETIYKGILPFLAALIVLTVLITLFPRIATYLPSLVTY